MGKELDTIATLLHQGNKRAIPVQNVWAVVKDVDWQNKTMTATGLTDDLDYFDILLGIGSIYTKPEVGSKVLIGAIANNDAASFLIWAEKIEAYLIQDKMGFKCHLNDGIMTFNGDDYEGIVKAPELKKQVDKNTEVLTKIQQVMNAWAPVAQDGGAALKALVAQFTSLPTADLSNIQNEKIKHG